VQLNNIPIQNAKTITILEITFDSKNTWCAYLKEIKKGTTIRMNVNKSLAHTSWRENATSLKKICKSLILSKLEYGCFL